MFRPIDDRDLMVRCGREQDREAFEEVVRRWDRRILSFLAKGTGDLEAAEDLRQEVFIRVYRFAASYDPRYAFATWLFRIAANAMKTWQTKQVRRRELLLSPDPSGALADCPDDAPDQRERLAATQSGDHVRRLIARLEPEERQVLLLRFEEEMSYREIGEVMGEPETTVKSRIYKLLFQLREQMQRAGIAERTVD